MILALLLIACNLFPGEPRALVWCDGASVVSGAAHMLCCAVCSADTNRAARHLQAEHMARMLPVLLLVQHLQ